MEYDSPFGPIVKHWLAKIELALEHKKKVFQNDADEAVRFYNGPYDFMYDKSFRASSRGFVYAGDETLPSPSFQMTVNKVAELVQIFGPALYHRNPVRRVSPRDLPDVSKAMIQAMNIDPMMLPPEMAMMMQQSQMQLQVQRGQDSGRALLYENYLSRTPYILDLKTESRKSIDEALIKGMGCLWTEVYTPPGANFKLIGSFHDSVDNLIIDPDAESLDDAKWIARMYVKPKWQFMQEYPGVTEDMLKSAQMSYDSAATLITDSDPIHRMRTGQTNDLIVYWRIYSKMGMGSMQKGVPQDLRGTVEVFGNYCHLVVCKGLEFFANLSPTVMSMGPEYAQEFVQWPTPFWADDGWPFIPIYFHSVPRQVWPMSHIRPAMGELKFLNWAYSFLAGKIRTACRDILAVIKGAGEELKKTILRGTDYELIELEKQHGETINNVVSWLQHPPFHGDIYKVLQLVEGNFDKRTGLSELAYGMSSRQMRSASEAQVKADQINVRPDDMANKVEEAMGELGRREALAARWHLQPQDVAPVMGDDAAMWWQQLVVSSDPASTLHSLDYRVEAGSARKPNRDRDAQNMDQAMQTIYPALMQYASGTGLVGPVNALMEDWAKSRDIDATRYLLPVPPPPAPPPEAGPGTNPPPEQKAQEQLAA
jgi:hypothetical protein